MEKYVHTSNEKEARFDLSMCDIYIFNTSRKRMNESLVLLFIFYLFAYLPALSFFLFYIRLHR